jgi:hypothetical protein
MVKVKQARGLDCAAGIAVAGCLGCSGEVIQGFQDCFLE